MLSQEQIEYLFKFCEKHLVYYYEVQVELVDHLANATELKMLQDKKLSFEDALNKVYADFGVMGFAPIVRDKMSLVQNKAIKNFWRQIRNQFGWPQVMFFLLMTAVFYSVLSMNFLVGVILIASLSLIGAGIGLYKQIRISKIVKKTGKKFIMMGYYHSFAAAWFAFYFYAQLLSHLDFVWNSAFILSIIGALVMVMVIAGLRLDKEMTNQVFSEYPEVFELAE